MLQKAQLLGGLLPQAPIFWVNATAQLSGRAAQQSNVSAVLSCHCPFLKKNITRKILPDP